MAVFGLPKLHEDDALRAVRAAAGMQGALDALNDELERRYGVRIANRTGVNTGEVVAGDPTAGQRLVTGDAVNVAARLEQAAGECEVLLGELTYKLVRDQIEAEAVEPLELKGKSQRVPAYRLVSIRETAEPRRRRAPLVGRAGELAQLADAFRAAVEARTCRLATVVAEAGVGKSRLIEELAAGVEQEALVLRGRCLPYGDGITFWPLVEVVRQAAGIAERDTAEEAAAKISAIAGEPDVAARVSAAVGLSAAPFPVEELFWGVRKLFETLARERPLVVVFEDIHSAERTFLELIEHVADTAVDAPILLVCNARHELIEDQPRWGEKQDGTQILLEPLSEADTGAFVATLLGEAGLDDSVRERIVAAAEGNPLFVEQMLSMLIDDGKLRFLDGRWQPAGEMDALSVPPTIHALLAARLDQLEPSERAVLEPASVVGHVFPDAAVRELVAEDLRESVEDKLAALELKQFVRPDPSQPAEEEWHRFSHILIRDTAYERLLKRARASLHERFVQWADRVNRDRAAEYEEILGYHLEQAYRYLSELGPLDEHGREVGADAGRRLRAAGLRALTRGDVGAAKNLLGRATALLPALGQERLELLPSYGQALFQTGDFTAAEAVLEEAIAGSQALGAQGIAAHATLVRLLVRLHSGAAEQWNDEAIIETNEAIAVFDSLGDYEGLARAWRYLGYAHGNACRFGDMAAAVAHALENARLAGDARQYAWSAKDYAAALLYGPTPVEEAIERCKQIMGEIADDRQAHGLVLAHLAQLEAMRQRFGEARALYRSARTLLEDLGAHVMAASVSLHSARVELLAGDLAAAHNELSYGYEALERVGDRYFRPTLAAWLARVLYEQGRLSEAEAYTQTAEALAADDDVFSQALWRSARAKILTRLGNWDEAIGLSDEALALLARTDATVLRADALHDHAQVLHAHRRGHEAHGALADAIRLAESKGSLADAQRLRGLLRELHQAVPASVAK
jgi:predicted ATPase